MSRDDQHDPAHISLPPRQLTERIRLLIEERGNQPERRGLAGGERALMFCSAQSSLFDVRQMVPSFLENVLTQHERMHTMWQSRGTALGRALAWHFFSPRVVLLSA